MENFSPDGEPEWDPLTVHGNVRAAGSCGRRKESRRKEDQSPCWICATLMELGSMPRWKARARKLAPHTNDTAPV